MEVGGIEPPSEESVKSPVLRAYPFFKISSRALPNGRQMTQNQPVCLNLEAELFEVEPLFSSPYSGR